MRITKRKMQMICKLLNWSEVEVTAMLEGLSAGICKKLTAKELSEVALEIYSRRITRWERFQGLLKQSWNDRPEWIKIPNLTITLPRVPRFRSALASMVFWR